MKWDVTSNESFRLRLGELEAEAVSFGQHEAFVLALRRLWERLSADPLAAGELRYHLPTGRPFLVIAQAPVVFLYAVYEVERKVWVTKAHRMASPSE